MTIVDNKAIRDFCQETAQMNEQCYQQMQNFISSIEQQRSLPEVVDQAERLNLILQLTNQVANTFFSTADQLNRLLSSKNQIDITNLQQQLDLNSEINQQNLSLLKKEMDILQNQNTSLHNINEKLQGQLSKSEKQRKEYLATLEHLIKLSKAESQKAKTIQDIKHHVFLFVGESTDRDHDHTVYACGRDNFCSPQRYRDRTAFKIIDTADSNVVRIRNVINEAFLFIGKAKDSDGDYTVYACPKDNFSSSDTFSKRTAFQVITTDDGFFRFFNKASNSYLFVGNDQDSAKDHTLYASPKSNFSNMSNFNARTAFRVADAYI